MNEKKVVSGGVIQSAMAGACAAAAMVAFGGWTKIACLVGPSNRTGSSTRPVADRYRNMCYSDLSELWGMRRIYTHQLPYQGGIVKGVLSGTVIEYPTLNGLVLWLAGRGVSSAVAFVAVCALVSMVLAAVIGWLLAKRVGARVWWWAASPLVAFYAVLNFDLMAVLAVVAAVAVMSSKWRDPHLRAVVASLLLGLGCAAKLVPGFFVVPLLVHVWTSSSPRHTRRTAGWCVGVFVGVLAVFNLPFMVALPDGWLASLRFQMARRADFTTNSIWYWGLRQFVGDGLVYHRIVSVAAPLLMLVGWAAAFRWGSRRTGAYPWVTVGTFMLMSFIYLNKVHSPQYALWLLPLLLLLGVPQRLVAAYVLSDVVLAVGCFWYLSGTRIWWHSQSPAMLLLVAGIYGQLVVIVRIVRFLAARGSDGPVSSKLPIAGATSGLCHEPHH